MNRLASFFLSIIFILLLSLTVCAQTQTRDSIPGNASISGRVTIGGNPAVNKKVTVAEMKTQGESAGISLEGLDPDGGEAFSALTDADGRYRVTGLPAGNYSVKVELAAYVPEKQGSERSRTIALDKDEVAENVDFSLVRGGVLTGRVTDSEGKPLIARLVRLQNVQGGQKSEVIGPFDNDMFQTDDRGVYRLYGLPAGRYIVSVGSASFGNASHKYPLTYHPDVTDEKQATVIEVKEGSEITGVDIRLGSVKTTYEAIGKVIDADTGSPVAKASLICFGSSESGGGPLGSNAMANTDAQGNFRFAGLPPGHYTVAISPDFLIFGQGEYYSEDAKFQITNGNISGVEVKARRGATISGIAVLENSKDPSLKGKLGQMMISASIQQKGVLESGFDLSGLNMAKINNDGSFRISGLRPGIATFQIVSIGGRIPIVTRIERDGVVMPGGIEIKPGEAVTGVRLILTYGSGVIRGQVNVIGGTLTEGSRISIYTHRVGSDEQGTYGGQVMADDKGRFVVGGLVDGEYELMVMAMPKMVLPGEPGNPAPLPQTRATERVRVTNGAETQVTINLDLSKRGEQK
jgi:Carboxypeptidase regulatory-like domain